jgi:hypothetical protein
MALSLVWICHNRATGTLPTEDIMDKNLITKKLVGIILHSSLRCDSSPHFGVAVDYSGLMVHLVWYAIHYTLEHG